MPIRVWMIDPFHPALRDLPEGSPCRDCAKFPCKSSKKTLLSCASQQQRKQKES